MSKYIPGGSRVPSLPPVVAGVVDPLDEEGLFAVPISSLICGLRCPSGVDPPRVGRRDAGRSPFIPLCDGDEGGCPLLSLAEEDDEGGAVPPRLGLALDIIEEKGRLFCVLVLDSPGEGGGLSFNLDSALEGGGKNGSEFIIVCQEREKDLRVSRKSRPNVDRLPPLWLSLYLMSSRFARRRLLPGVDKNVQSNRDGQLPAERVESGYADAAGEVDVDKIRREERKAAVVQGGVLDHSDSRARQRDRSGLAGSLFAW